MGKKKKRKREADAPAAPAPPLQPPQRIELTAADVDTTIRTLTYLATRPEVLASKPLRGVRAALHPLIEKQRERYDPIDYAARVTVAMRAGRGADALLALQGLHSRGQVVRQGTVQRWVRDCDSVGDQSLRVQLLHAVLRAGKPLGDAGASADDDDAAAGDDDEGDAEEDDEEAAAEEEEEDGDDDGEPSSAQQRAESAGQPPAAAAATADGVEQSAVRRLASWYPTTDASKSEAAAGPSDGAPEATGAVSGLEGDLGLRVVLTERGPDRQPPNHHDLHIHACSPSLSLLDASPPPSTRRANVPGVPGAFVMLDVLSPRECAALTKVAEAMGFGIDHPVARPTASGIGACEWLFDEQVMEALLQRCRPHLPATLGGGRLAGINQRCRFFRYTDVDNAVYRPHIDGSWPGSGLDATGRYVHDAYGDRRSRLTFLIYLNERFEGGCTTFYLPAADGGLTARGVQPRAGSVLCFPQGNTASLLHEGSAVTRGTKDVVRSDVLYTIR